jgi:predicted O-methyltransferase YrrM
MSGTRYSSSRTAGRICLDRGLTPCKTVAMFEHNPQAGWIAVEEFVTGSVVHPDGSLQRAVQSAADAGMPPIEVAPNAGKLLKLLVQMCGARRVLEIGTLAGFSTLWMAQGLPDDGRLVTCEYLTKHADVARANLDAAGVGHKVEIRVGAALDSLATLEAEGQEPFDFVFIDADKENDGNYLEWAIRLGRPGTTVVLDNAVWEGAILEPAMDPVNAPGIISALDLLGRHPRLDATVIQTVGSKGWDGFALAVVR